MLVTAGLAVMLPAALVVLLTADLAGKLLPALVVLVAADLRMMHPAVR